MKVSRYVSVVQRRLLQIDSREGFLIPLLEPLFAIPAHMAFEERLKLFQLALALRREFVACEIGSYLGSSTTFLAAAAALREGRVHAVDTWKNDAMPNEPVLDTYEAFVHNVQPFREYVSVHRGWSKDMKDEIPQIDLLFVDGDHSYEGALADLTEFAPKIVSGGLLVLHDYAYESVRTAVADYFRAGLPNDLGMVHSLQTFQMP